MTSCNLSGHLGGGPRFFVKIDFFNCFLCFNTFAYIELPWIRYISLENIVCTLKCWRNFAHREGERSGKLCSCARTARQQCWGDVSLGEILSHEACGESHRSATYDLIGGASLPSTPLLPTQPYPNLNHPTPVYPTLTEYPPNDCSQVEGSVSLRALPPPHPPTLAYTAEAFQAWKLQRDIINTLCQLVL